ncbi:MAG: anti-sigma factor [Rhodospirillales bacterium]|nr:anti-sigma factor [Rhodospirillales bacterium]
MMTRPVAEEELHAYLDGFLDEARRQEIAAYLARNPAEEARIAGYARQRDALRAACGALAETPIPPALNIGRMIAAAHDRRRRRLRYATAAMIALGMLSLGGAGGWMARGAMGTPHGGVAGLSHVAAVSYTVFAPDHLHPVEFRADQRRALMDWIATRTGTRIMAPDLRASGYRFMGGRLVATEHGPAALFMYDDDRGTRLVLLGQPMRREDRNAPMARFQDARVGGYSWAMDGIGYSLAGPVSVAAGLLHPLANEARRQIADRM